jgi:dipeptidyl aminopeptidase/acylaminoacyl peptidase
LSWLARESGGMFYQMRDLNELPRIIARDARDAIGKLPFSEGYFRPITSKHADWNFEVSQWPVLKGYLTATAKNNANVELEIGLADSPDPLLSQWALGRGRVSVFTSDADTRWSPEWVRWDDFENVWASILNYVMRPRYSKDVFVWVDESKGVPQIVIEGEFEDPSAQLISRDGSSEVYLGLIQETDFRWRAAIANAESDWYQLLLEADSREAQKEALPIVRRWVRIGSAERGVEQQGLAPDEQLLRRISQATGGLFNEPDAAFLPPTEPMRIAHPIDRFVLPVVILLLLLEIAIRGRTML